VTARKDVHPLWVVLAVIVLIGNFAAMAYVDKNTTTAVIYEDAQPWVMKASMSLYGPLAMGPRRSFWLDGDRRLTPINNSNSHGELDAYVNGGCFYLKTTKVRFTYFTDKHQVQTSDKIVGVAPLTAGGGCPATFSKAIGSR